MKFFVFTITLQTCILLKHIECLRMYGVQIPSHSIRGQVAHLECNFDMDGEGLYSVKWYKDGNEFYRYVPRNTPPGKIFPLRGVYVSLSNSSANVVTLAPVTLLSSGRYRCEVSAEAPSFQTVTDHGNMTVVAMPEAGPVITGGRPTYHIGDIVRLNCTSGKSKPATQLSWFINGELADRHVLRGPQKIVTGHEGLETTILGLEFKVRHKHFKNDGEMKLKCLAKIGSIYRSSNEENVETLPRRLQKHQPVLQTNNVHVLDADIKDDSTFTNPFKEFSTANTSSKKANSLIQIIFCSIALLLHVELFQNLS